MPRIGLIGDFDESVPAHRAIPIALDLISQQRSEPVEVEWIPTDTINSDSVLAPFDGLWCVPASPYRSMEGAIRAIRFAREHKRAFLGTCGGFQHGVLEYARNVLGWSDAEHAETAPDSNFQVISPLHCALVETTDAVYFVEGSHLRRAYNVGQSNEGYRCSYGLNPDFRAKLASGPLRVSAIDSDDEVRGLELDNHPFFVMTLFQPERAALRQKIPPIAASFVSAAEANA